MAYCLAFLCLAYIHTHTHTHTQKVPIRQVLRDLDTDPTLDKDKLRTFLQKIPIGLIANTPFDGGIHGNKSGFSVDEWRALQRGIQEVAQELKMPPILYALDAVHGNNYVLNGNVKMCLCVCMCIEGIF